MRSYGRWKVTYPGAEFIFEPDEMLSSECAQVEKRTETTFDQWMSDVDDGKSQACLALVWFLRNKANDAVQFEAVDLPLRQLTLQQIDEQGRHLQWVERTRMVDDRSEDYLERQTLIDGEWVDTATLDEGRHDAG